MPEGVVVTSVEDAQKFVAATGIDLFAPAVGNFHGMLSDGTAKKLDIERIAAIELAVGIPLVLHGGSSDSKEDLQNAIRAGVAIVHINTEIRVAFVNALKASIAEHPTEVAPYKLLAPTITAVQKVIDDKLKFFNFI